MVYFPDLRQVFCVTITDENSTVGIGESHPPTQVVSSAGNSLVGSAVSNLTTPAQTPALCSIRKVAPRRLSSEYNKICKTHKKLVKSGSVTCSVRLSDSPTKVAATVNPLDSTPDATRISVPPATVEGSVHWGSLRDISGVQTPATSPTASSPPSASTSGLAVPQPSAPPLPSKVIRSAPPRNPPRNIQRPSLSTSVPTSVISGAGQSGTPLFGVLGAIPKRLSSTNPEFLQSKKIPIVSTSVSSL